MSSISIHQFNDLQFCPVHGLKHLPNHQKQYSVESVVSYGINQGLNRI